MRLGYWMGTAWSEKPQQSDHARTRSDQSTSPDQTRPIRPDLTVPIRLLGTVSGTRDWSGLVETEGLVELVRTDRLVGLVSGPGRLVGTEGSDWVGNWSGVVGFWIGRGRDRALARMSGLALQANVSLAWSRCLAGLVLNLAQNPSRCQNCDTLCCQRTARNASTHRPCTSQAAGEQCVPATRVAPLAAHVVRLP